jgi:DNA-binding NarL/FixJ family response regulator
MPLSTKDWIHVILMDTGRFPSGGQNTPSQLKNFMNEMKITCRFSNNTSRLYSLICNSSSAIDIVGIDLSILYRNGNQETLQTIQTIDSLLSSIGSSAVIAGGVELDTNIEHINDFVSLSPRCMGVYPIGTDFTFEEKELAFRSLKANIKYVPNQIKEKLDAAKKRESVEIKLTPRQQQILNLIVTRGASNKMIARALGITESTVKLHVAGLLKKHCVNNRTQLALFSKK